MAEVGLVKFAAVALRIGQDWGGIAERRMNPLRSINLVNEQSNLRQRIWEVAVLRQVDLLFLAVSYANFGKLRFKTEYEQHLWGECSRLLTNCIIASNTTLLFHLLAYRERLGDAQGAAALQQVSPVAWQHINFYGCYEFRRADLRGPWRDRTTRAPGDLLPRGDRPPLDPTVPRGHRVAERHHGAAPSARAS